MSKIRGYIGVGLLVASCAAIGQSGVSGPGLVYALDEPTSTPDRLSPAGFLPAPNPNPYCDSMEYFNFFPSNLRAIELQDNVQILQDTAWTNTDNTGISMTFKTLQESTLPNGQGSAPSGNLPTPMVTYGRDTSNGGLSTIGIIMNGGNASNLPAIADITLSEPMFYSQWVFTDLDQQQEGFDLYPEWVSPDVNYNRYGMYGPANDVSPGWSFETATPSTPDHAGFFTRRSGNVDGLDLKGRFQVDFYGPITGVEMARFGAGGSGFAAGAGCPPIGLSKAVTKSVWNAQTQQFEVQYLISVINNLPSQSVLNERVALAEENAYESLIVGGNALAIDTTSLQITDALKLDGFVDAEVTGVTASANLTPNPNYDGIGDINLVSGNDTLVAGGTGEIVLNVNYTPDFTDAGWDDCNYESVNQSEVKGVAAGVPISDLSDNGLDPAPAATNGDEGTDDPTPVLFGAIGCQVGLAKDYVEGSTTNNGDGTYTADYAFKVGNYGEANLTNFVLDDDLSAAYGDGFVSASTTKDECNSLNATGGLKPGEFCNITLQVIFKPISGIEKPWLNQASITATVGPDTAGVITTTDLSQDGDDPDPDGDGDPTNNTEPTPNQIGAAIGLAKRVTSGPTYNGDLTYDVTYSLVATNFGFAFLDNIVVNDDLEATFGANLVKYTSDDKCATATLPTFGDTCEVIVNVTFRPEAQTHWENSADVKGNAGGTEVTDVSQDGVDPDPDGNGDPTDNNDPTPVDVGFVDLALRLTSAEGESIVVGAGDAHTFNIEVFNQADLPAKDIAIVDYLPAGVVLNDTDWTDNGDGTASYTITETIEPGESVVVPITVTIQTVAAAGPIENNAEIVSQVIVDKDGTVVTEINGVALADIDSTPDAILGNDKLIDDKIDLTPDTGDEDDMDIAILTGQLPPTTTSPPPKTGAGGMVPMSVGALLMLVVGAMLLSARRPRATV